MNGERDGGGGEVRKGRSEREIAIYIIGKRERRRENTYNNIDRGRQ